METSAEPDLHARPPESIRQVYKRLQKSKDQDLESNNKAESGPGFFRPGGGQPLSGQLDGLDEIFHQFLGSPVSGSVTSSRPETCAVPGLLVYRSLLPPEIQLALLDRVLHRDLSNPQHKTNLHLHYNVPGPDLDVPCHHYSHSFFDECALGLEFTPRDPEMHAPISTRLALNRKLRWITLGKQYDWTAKRYPREVGPAFPSDIAHLISGMFAMRPEAAIVNLYNPGDTLSLHRDVSEACDEKLVSVSLGCEGIFVIGIGCEEPKMSVLRLRSGDVVVMAGDSRSAWHGVPKVIAGTCPEWLQNWPHVNNEGDHKEWKGWMRGKRINLNVRQIMP